MSFKTKVLITVLVVVGFDTVASFLSRSFHFEYTRLMWVSFLIYLVVGYWGAHRRGFVYGMLLGTIAGLVDSTIGWFVSRMIGPFLQADIPVLGPLVVAMVIIIVTASAFLFGSVGAVLCKVLGQTKTADA
jgi:thiamine transporter ThiT